MNENLRDGAKVELILNDKLGNRVWTRRLRVELSKLSQN